MPYGDAPYTPWSRRNAGAQFDEWPGAVDSPLVLRENGKLPACAVVFQAQMAAAVRAKNVCRTAQTTVYRLGLDRETVQHLELD